MDLNKLKLRCEENGYYVIMFNIIIIQFQCYLTKLFSNNYLKMFCVTTLYAQKYNAHKCTDIFATRNTLLCHSASVLLIKLIKLYFPHKLLSE